MWTEEVIQAPLGDKLTLKAPIVTHTQFLPPITLPHQTDRPWVLKKDEMLYVRTNSLKQYHKECMKNSVEKMHVDVAV